MPEIGLVTVFQPIPSQCSVRVLSLPVSVYCPTAQISFDEMVATLTSPLSPVPTLGLATVCQDSPQAGAFQESCRVAEKPAPLADPDTGWPMLPPALKSPAVLNVPPPPVIANRAWLKLSSTRATTGTANKQSSTSPTPRIPRRLAFMFSLSLSSFLFRSTPFFASMHL